MDRSLTEIVTQYMDNLTQLRNTLRWEHSEIYPVGAAQLTGHGIAVSREQLTEARRILKQETGILSNFRGNGMVAVICALASSPDPSARMEASKTMYRLLKEEFHGSAYLASAAVLLPELISEEEAPRYIERGRELYLLMKKEHPFLTSSEDSVLAVLLAFSEKNDEALVREMESAYDHLKEQIRWSGSDYLQTVSHILTLGRRNAADSARRLLLLLESLKNAGHAYGRSYQLTALAALALSDRDNSALVRDITEADAFLAAQDPYSGLFGFSRKSRLMHAAMLVTLEDNASAVPDAGILSGTLAMIAAQQAAMCAIMASAAASSAAASH